MLKHVSSRRAGNKARRPDLFWALLSVAAVVILIITAINLYALANGSVDSLRYFGLGFLVGTDWVPNPFPSLFLPAETIPSVIANEFTEVSGNELYLSALFELGLILFAIAFMMNLAGRILITRLRFKGGSDKVA